jgi:hypothetical protein
MPDSKLPPARTEEILALVHRAEQLKSVTALTRLLGRAVA